MWHHGMPDSRILTGYRQAFQAQEIREASVRVLKYLFTVRCDMEVLGH